MMPLVTVTTLQYKPGARFRAFANMGRFLMKPIKAQGLRFQKLMGSGYNYGLIPNLSIYVFLGVWEDEAAIQAFWQTDAYQQLARGTTHVSTLYLEPTKSHGFWDGQNPFEDVESKSAVPSDGLSTEVNQPFTAVLTRATIRPGALLDFWRHVPQARQRLRDHRDDLVFGIGVGEVPVVQQCTISVWRSPTAVERFAYRESGHKEIVRMTRQRKWYSEELFARFTVLKVEGDLPAIQ